jgi:hypothetical protein
MKATLAVLLLLNAASLHGADELPIVLSISGPDRGATGITMMAMGFALDVDHSDVTIAAGLANHGGLLAYGGAGAYLMRSIGPGTTRAEQVAETQFVLPPGYNDYWTLFSGLELRQGFYWVVLRDLRNGIFSYAGWTFADMTSFHEAKGIRYLGARDALLGPWAPYPPATRFGELYPRLAWRLMVAGVADDD